MGNVTCGRAGFVFSDNIPLLIDPEGTRPKVLAVCRIRVVENRVSSPAQQEAMPSLFSWVTKTPDNASMVIDTSCVGGGGTRRADGTLMPAV